MSSAMATYGLASSPVAAVAGGGMVLAGSVGNAIDGDTTVVSVVPSSDVDDEDMYDLQDYPDGGFGWIVVLAVFMLQMARAASMFTFGVFAREYHDHVFPRNSVAYIALIGSLAAGIQKALGVFTGPLSARMGWYEDSSVALTAIHSSMLKRNAAILGGMLMTGGNIFASFSDEIWQLFLTQGVIVGIGASLINFSVSSVPAQWFKIHRGIANGVGSAGTGVGGMVFSVVADRMIQYNGYKVALRLIAVATLLVTVIFGPLLQTRLPRRLNWGFDRTIFKHRDFMRFVGVVAIGHFAYYVPFTYIAQYGKALDINHATTSIIVGMLSLSGAFGRIMMGLVADSIGSQNAYSVALVGAAIPCAFVWPFTTSITSLVIFAVWYGFLGGSFIALVAVVLTDYFGIKTLATTNGFIFSFGAFGSLFGPPLAGVLMDAFRSGSEKATNIQSRTSFLPAMIFTVIGFVLAALLLNVAPLKRLVHAAPALSISNPPTDDSYGDDLCQTDMPSPTRQFH